MSKTSKNNGKALNFGQNSGGTNGSASGTMKGVHTNNRDAGGKKGKKSGK